MFTGIIEDLGQVTRLERSGGGAQLTVASRLATGDLVAIKLGDSIAVSGACLTVIRHLRGAFTFDVSLETLERTTLGALGSGTQVHLERALTLGARLDGHLVQGHVDATATLVENAREGEGWRLTYALPERLLGQVVEKGSIAIDGVSLTIASLIDDRVSVAVVPHTDILGKYVERMLTLGRAPAAAPTAARGHHEGGLTLARLGELGFLK
jgi:riboflavin synthase